MDGSKPTGNNGTSASIPQVQAILAGRVEQTAASGGDIVHSLSPEMLLTYCSARLNSIDTNINQYFAEQQKKNKDMTDATKLVGSLGAWTHVTKLSDLSAQGQQDHVNKGNELLALYKTIDSPELRAKAAHAFREITGKDISGFLPDGKVESINTEHMQGMAAAQWSSLIEEVKGIQSSTSKSAEMNMIQLQALVSQRQLAVQLTTQLMQACHEGMKAPIANMRV